MSSRQRRLILYDENNFRLVKSQEDPPIHFITHQCPKGEHPAGHAIWSGPGISSGRTCSMSESKTEARQEAGFIILYDEGDWLVGFYDFNKEFLHIFNKDTWGGFENDKDYSLGNVPQTVKDRYMFWLHMLVA